ncbi:MAG: hypothetical protein WBP45_11040 [Daejeonella sp.]
MFPNKYNQYAFVEQPTLESLEDKTYRRLHYNKPQLRSMLVGANEETAVWGRGTGKSTGLIAPQSINCIFKMPRSRGVFVGETYLQLLERTLPPVIQGWEEMGYKRDLDFWVRKTPPKSFEVPNAHIGPLTADHSITWRNGTVISLISQDRPGTSNGMSVDWIMGDEAKLLNKQRLDEELAPTNRGNERYFRHVPEHHSTLFASDMPTSPKGKWLLERKEQMDVEQIKLILSVQLAIYEARKAGKLKKVKQLLQYWDELRSTAVYYSEASTLENIEVLGVKFIRRLKRTLPDLVFQTAVLNQPLTQVENGFYAYFDDDLIENGGHCYHDIDYAEVDKHELWLPNSYYAPWKKDSDLDTSRPLSIALDYNASINPLVVGQRFGQYLRFQNALYVCHPMRLKDVIKEFCKYYKGYPTQEVNYFYDHTSVGTNSSSDISYSDEVRDLLEKEGWHVRMNYIGQALSHHSRYILWGYGLKGDDKRFLQPRFNKGNTTYLQLSMQQAGTKQVGSDFKKDKGEERKLQLDQRVTTHFSDAGDTLFVGECTHYLNGDTSLLETMFLS